MLVYIIRVFNKEESFLKIGMTSLSVYSRFKRKEHMPYNYVVVSETKGNIQFIKELEKFILRGSLVKYRPIIPFKGITECFCRNQIIK